MKTDFLDAHGRHWVDAEHLFQAARWANADHLYGLAAECGLKRLMQAFGMPFDTIQNRPHYPADRVHINDVWARFETYRSGHALGVGYALPSSNPFVGWAVSDRYAKESNFDSVSAQKHQAGAKEVRLRIEKAQREGCL